MFTIIGGDGKEYGPVTIDQVRAWIAAGRANHDTQAKRIGDEQWRRVGDFPEFAAAEPTAPQPPLSTAGSADPKAIADELIARAAPLDIGGCLERGWNLLKANFWPLVGVTFLMTVVMMVAGSIPIIGILSGLLLTGVFYGGLYLYYLKRIRGQPTDLGDLFAGFSIAFVPLMLATLVSSLLTCIGFILLILPGIYLAVAYSFTYLLAIDRRLDFWVAMEVSRRVITAQWWRMFGLVLLGVIIAALGLIGFIVGIFITIPIFLGAIVFAYEDLCNPPAAVVMTPPASPAPLA